LDRRWQGAFFVRIRRIDLECIRRSRVAFISHLPFNVIEILKLRVWVIEICVDDVGIDDVGIDDVGVDDVGVDNVGIYDVRVDNIRIEYIRFENIVDGIVFNMSGVSRIN